MSRFDSSFINDVAHRPWPMPARPWLMTQSWHDLLFAHWPLDRDRLRPLIPHEFDLDLFDGQAWIGIVPFEMRNVAPRGVPALPWLSAFPELNVRTYVRAENKPGVYFFSLDAARRVAVWTARLSLNLPYFLASMTIERTGTVVEYRSRRRGSAAPAELIASYAPTGAPFTPQRGTLDYFLTERYCLYARDRRDRPYRLDIHHAPWTLQPARAELPRNSMAAAAGIALPAVAPLLHFASRQDMVAWGPQMLSD